MKRFFLAIFCILCLSASVQAVDVVEEQVRQFGIDSLQGALPAGAEELIPDLSPLTSDNLSSGVGKIIVNALPQTGSMIKNSLRVAVSMMVVLLLCAMVTQIESTFSRDAVLLAGALAITILSVSNLRSMVGLGQETMYELQSFAGLLIPVLASASAASGGIGTASVMNSATVFITNLFISVMNNLLVPLVYAFLAMSAANAVLANQTLKKLQDFIKWLISNGLKLLVFLFTGYLSISGVISGASDGASLKAAKLVASTVVPVVGSMISDASETVLASAQMIKGAVGVFGMLAVLAISIIPLLRLGVQQVILKLTAAVCATFSEKALIELIESVANAVGFLMAMTASCGFMLLISCVCTMKAVTP